MNNLVRELSRWERPALELVAAAGEADAWLRLAPADAASHFGEAFAQRVALFDYALKQGRAWLIPGK